MCRSSCEITSLYLLPIDTLHDSSREILFSSSHLGYAGKSYGLCQTSPYTRNLFECSFKDIPRSVPISVKVKTTMRTVEETSDTETLLPAMTAPLACVGFTYLQHRYSLPLSFILDERGEFMVGKTVELPVESSTSTISPYPLEFPENYRRIVFQSFLNDSFAYLVKFVVDYALLVVADFLDCFEGFLFSELSPQVEVVSSNSPQVFPVEFRLGIVRINCGSNVMYPHVHSQYGVCFPFRDFDLNRDVDIPRTFSPYDFSLSEPHVRWHRNMRSDGSENASSNAVNRNLKPIFCELSFSPINLVDIVSKNEWIPFALFRLFDPSQKPFCLLLGGGIEWNSLIAMKVSLKVLVFSGQKFLFAFAEFKNLSLDGFLRLHERHAHKRNMLGGI